MHPHPKCQQKKDLNFASSTVWNRDIPSLVTNSWSGSGFRFGLAIVTPAQQIGGEVSSHLAVFRRDYRKDQPTTCTQPRSNLKLELDPISYVLRGTSTSQMWKHETDDTFRGSSLTEFQLHWYLVELWMNWVDQRNTDREYEVNFFQAERTRRCYLSQAAHRRRMLALQPHRTPPHLNPHGFFAISVFAFKVFVGFSYFSSTEREKWLWGLLVLW